MKYIKLFENFNYLYDIEDIFLELQDSGFKLYKESFPKDSDYPFTNEFLIYKKGNSGYFIGGDEIELFNLYIVIDVILRFVELCKINGLKYRIITQDGQFTINLTNKLNNLLDINKDDVLKSTHLHLKRESGMQGRIDLENIKFVSCQILK
jgi:hypothetical protein